MPSFSSARVTQRLRLDPLHPADEADVFRIYGDPATWTHLPSGRFTTPEQARLQIEASMSSHRQLGLGMWGIRILPDPASDPAPARNPNPNPNPNSGPNPDPAPGVRPVGRNPVGTHPAAGTFIGSGGAQYVADGGVWNIGYRLSPSAWGQGFATEVAREAVRAARECAPGVPITARVLTNNPASIAVLERLGLELMWEGAAAASVENEGAALRRVYADRALPPAAEKWLLANA